MKEIATTYTQTLPGFPSKSEWGNGPWQNEPDKLQFVDEATGLPCLIVRNHFGSLCGYVGVSEGHPLFGQHYRFCDDIEVHGGLTFAGFCQAEGEGAICHVVEPGEDDNVFWLGFDTGHCFDIIPGMRKWSMQLAEHIGGGTYRDLEYLKKECRELARQLAERAISSPGRRIGFLADEQE